MVNYCNKRFFVIFLSLSLTLPICGMEKSNRNIFSGIFKTIVNTIKSPLSYLYKRFSPTSFQKKCDEDKENFQISRESNKPENVQEKNFSDTSKTTRNFIIPLITILYLYRHKPDNYFETLKTMRIKNENNSARLQNALDKARDKTRKNKFTDEDCNEINNCLKQNINVNFCDNFGRNQLHIMVEMFAHNPKQFDVKIFENLLSGGVKLAPDNDGVTPLGAMMLMPHFKGQNNKVNEYETVLSLLIDSVGANETNVVLVTERKKAWEYFDTIPINRLNLNRLNNNIVTGIKESKKGIIKNYLN